jgi:hypothetical protein
MVRLRDLADEITRSHAIGSAEPEFFATLLYTNLLLLVCLVKGFLLRAQNLAVDQAELIDDEGDQTAVTQGLTPIKDIKRPVRVPESATIVAEHHSIDEGDCTEILISRRQVVSLVDVRADAPSHLPASMAAIFLHLLTLLIMGIFSTRIWALPHGNRKLSLPKWVLLPLTLTPVILYPTARYSMYLFFPLCIAPSGPTRWGSSFFGALVAGDLHREPFQNFRLARSLSFR